MNKHNAITKPCDKKSKTAEYKIQRILNKIDTLKLSDCYLAQLKLPKNPNVTKKVSSHPKLYTCVGLVVLLIAIFLKWYSSELTSEKCLLELPRASSMALFRAPEDCSMCEGVEDVVRLANITAEEFEEFAYNTTPVIVTDATQRWRALKEFDFNFFVEFYRNVKMRDKINPCFFFAYQSGLNSLEEVFAMDENRANLEGKPWYVGWNTCYREEVRHLRDYYSRPYFLPPSAESLTTDWLFMGGPGMGAHMHVDSVRYKSWQAQVRGRKQWELAPPPECLYACRPIRFTVEPGEILVVDTNRWYHKTTVLPGDISITIGAEYD